MEGCSDGMGVLVPLRCRKEGRMLELGWGGGGVWLRLLLVRLLFRRSEEVRSFDLSFRASDSRSTLFQRPVLFGSEANLRRIRTNSFSNDPVLVLYS